MRYSADFMYCLFQDKDKYIYHLILWILLIMCMQVPFCNVHIFIKRKVIEGPTIHVIETEFQRWKMYTR